MSESQRFYLNGMFCGRPLPATLPRLLSFKPLHFWSRRGKQPPSWFSHSPLLRTDRGTLGKGKREHFTILLGSPRLPGTYPWNRQPHQAICSVGASPLPTDVLPWISGWMPLSRGLPSPLPWRPDICVLWARVLSLSTIAIWGQTISIVGAAMDIIRHWAASLTPPQLMTVAPPHTQLWCPAITPDMAHWPWRGKVENPGWESPLSCRCFIFLHGALWQAVQSVFFSGMQALGKQGLRFAPAIF